MYTKKILLILTSALIIATGILYALIGTGKSSKEIIELSSPNINNVKELNYKLEFVVGNQYGNENEIFSQPHVAISNNGDIYISDLYNDRLIRFDKNGKFINKVGKTGQGADDFLYPYCITVGNDNYIYVLETLNKRIKCYDENLNLIRIIKPLEFFGSNFIVNSKGEIYLRTTEKGKLFSIFNSHGQKIASIDKPIDIVRWDNQKIPYRFEAALDNNDNLYVAYLFSDSCFIDKYSNAESKILRTTLLLPDLIDRSQSKTSNIILTSGNDNYLYLLLIPSNVIYKLDTDGEVKGRILLSLPNQNTIPVFISLTIDDKSNIYITDYSSVMFFRYSKNKTS